MWRRAGWSSSGAGPASGANEQSGGTAAQRNSSVEVTQMGDSKDEGQLLSDEEEELYDPNCMVSCCGRELAFEKRKLTYTMIFTLVILASFGTIYISLDYALSGGKQKHIVAWYSAGMFVILGVSLSLYEIFMHLTNYSNPGLQRYIVRILWMVPIYAIESWFSLRFKSQAIYLESAREAYEAYVIYNFFYLLTAYLGGEQAIIRDSLRRNQPEKEHHLWPMNHILSQWRTGKQFVVRCKLGTLQYVVIKLLLTVATFCLESAGNYDEGNLSPDGAYLYIAFVSNMSQVWAMYCLVLLYHAYHDELEGLRPLPKFLCVKAVVFFSFWQQVLIAILVKEGVIHQTFDYSTDEIARGCQDYLICIEMLIAAVAHMFSFSWTEFMVRVRKAARQPLLEAFLNSALPGEAITDTMRLGRGVGRALVGYGQHAIQGAGAAVSIVHKRVRKIVRKPVRDEDGNINDQEVVEEEFVQVRLEDANPEDTYEIVNIKTAEGKTKSIAVISESGTKHTDTKDLKDLQSASSGTEIDSAS